MANPISNWLYTGAAPGTQAATQAAAQTTPWGQVEWVETQIDLQLRED